MRDPDTGNSKGYAFINFASFGAADAAIESMNGQYLCNRAISISYAFKKGFQRWTTWHTSRLETFLFINSANSQVLEMAFVHVPPFVSFVIPEHGDRNWNPKSQDVVMLEGHSGQFLFACTRLGQKNRYLGHSDLQYENKPCCSLWKRNEHWRS